MEDITLTKSKQDLLTTSIGLCIQGTVGNVMNIGNTDHEAICKKTRLQYDNHGVEFRVFTKTSLLWTANTHIQSDMYVPGICCT
jgi:hypothetical protein